MNYTKEDMENFASYAIKHEDLFYHTDLLKMWDKENRTASRESRQLSAVPSRENIRRIIELTASVESDGSTYGMDTNIGDVEDLIDLAEDILRGIAG